MGSTLRFRPRNLIKRRKKRKRGRQRKNRRRKRRKKRRNKKKWKRTKRWRKRRKKKWKMSNPLCKMKSCSLRKHKHKCLQIINQYCSNKQPIKRHSSLRYNRLRRKMIKHLK